MDYVFILICMMRNHPERDIEDNIKACNRIAALSPDITIPEKFKR